MPEPVAPEGYSAGAEWRHDVAAIALMILMVAGGILAYGHLPPVVPTHWGLHGQPNGWSSRLVAVVFPPALTLALWALLLVLPQIDPRRRNYALFIGFYRALRLALVLLMAVLYATALLSGMGYHVSIPTVTTIAVSGLIIFLGNFMGRLRHNWFVGIRTPWTLANEEVWRQTHRVGGRLFVIGGFLPLAGLFFSPAAAFVLLMVGVLGAALLSVVYSYLVYHRVVGA